MKTRSRRSAWSARWATGALLLAPFAAWPVAPYSPPDQPAVSRCSQNALEAHPGEVEFVHVGRGSGPLRLRVYIRQADGREWIVACDGDSGAIGNSILVDDLFQP